MASNTDIARFAARLEALGKDTRPFAEAFADASLKEIRSEFRGEVSPYGVPWAPTRRSNPILDDTGKLKRAFTAEVTDSGFKIVNETPYAAAHQFGAERHASTSIATRSLWHNPATGRFVSKKTNLKAVYESTFHPSRGASKLPARPMLPTDGLPVSWLLKFESLSSKLIRAFFKR